MRQSAPLRLAQLALLAATLAASASTRDSLADPKLAARIDGQAVPLAGLHVLHVVAAYKDMRTPLNKVLASVIDNRLLGDYAQTHFEETTLFPNTGVAFARDVAVEDQLIATLRRADKQQIDAALTKAGGLDGMIAKRYAPTAAALAGVFPPTSGLLLSTELTSAQFDAARGIALVDYRFPGGETGRISLADVWHRQNIQGKTRIAGGDTAYRDQQAMQLLAGRYILFWARHDGGLGEDDLVLLRRSIEDRDRRGALLQVLGVEADMHYASPNLKRLAATVTPTEVRDYYERNPSEFKEIEKARARHIHCADEATCQRAYAKLDHGAAFADIAREFSDAPDAKQGGLLDTLTPDKGREPWLYELAFALPPGKPSRPVREPPMPGRQAGWQIVMVESRQEKLQPETSEAVRYIASQAIARQKALAEFKALREQLYHDADIELNPKALGFNRQALAQ